MDIPEQGFQIANMTSESVGVVAEIERLCFTSPWSRDMLAKELVNPLAVFRVASVEDKIIGYVGMHHVIDEGYITNIAVHPDYRQKGIAHALMDALLEYGGQNGLCMITLEVRESNVAARCLYESLRFGIVGRRKGFYSRPSEDAILMTYRYG